MEEVKVQERNVDLSSLQTTVPVKQEDVVPLNYEAALASYAPEEAEKVINLAESIDVRKIDNVMSYGAVPLTKTFEQCGQYLKDEKGSTADQEVIQQVMQLSKKANENYEDFNLVIKEPNFVQKAILKLSSKNARTKKIQACAITNYELFLALKESCESWLAQLKESMGDIYDSAESDAKTVELLEKYIIAGKLAQERIEKELNEIQDKYQNTGLQQYASQYDELKQGYDIFVITLNNLEKSRVMYKLSIAQLSLIRRSNRNVQISINTQVNESMALMGQQLRNAVLNAKTREVLEGNKEISRLNDELVMAVSKSVGLTAEEAEKMPYAGFYSTEAAKTAITTVIKSCEAIQNVAEEMLPKMKADMTELNALIEELEPYVNKVNAGNMKPEKTLTTTSSNREVDGLKF